MAEGIIDILKSITGSQVSSKEKEQIDELLKDATLFSRNKNNKEEEQMCC